MPKFRSLLDKIKGKLLYVPADDKESASLMAEHEERIFRTRMLSIENADAETERAYAHDVAKEFHTVARSHAYHERGLVKDYYEKYMPEYHSWREYEPDYWRELVPENMRGKKGAAEPEDLSHIRGYEGLRSLDTESMELAQFMEELSKWEERFPELEDWQGIREGIEKWKKESGIRAEAGGLEHAAMYLDPEKDLVKFIEKSRQKEGKPSYFNLELEGQPENITVRLSSNLFKHQAKKHPDMTISDNERLSEIIKNINGENTFYTGKKVFRELAILAVKP